ncbi:MAG TPA: TonB family protein [Gemmatimonadaceae bacterium]|nr:TonB family protein [Gemmatimonadaceae bacterium]
MMRLWKEEYSRPQRPTVGTALSIVVHAVLITLAVIATNPPEGFVSALNSLANKVIYVAPPPRIPSTEASLEKLEYVEAAPIGDGAGFPKGSEPGIEPEKKSVAFSARPGDLGTEQTPAIDSRLFASYDTVFTIAQVDSAVAIDPSSAAPAYPPALLKLGVEGSVMVRYVVDSLGRADVSTLQVVRSTRIEFAIAVREALPNMRFSPARMGAKAVPQLVEQPFNFRIQRPDTTAAAITKKPPF